MHLDRRGCSRAITRMCEWGGHAGASARRLQLRVTTPLASTAIFHLLTSFQNFGLTIPDPVPTRRGQSSYGRGLSRRVIANRQCLLSCRINDPAREISVVSGTTPATVGSQTDDTGFGGPVTAKKSSRQIPGVTRLVVVTKLQSPDQASGRSISYNTMIKISLAANEFSGPRAHD